ncbi:hypothetical protein EDB83DRAFT_2316690 [Lactarius deliciosus]|nr:hypothetical protein EDB83DRAFT_2316690 [Lactarius deliciosus]
MVQVMVDRHCPVIVVNGHWPIVVLLPPLLRPIAVAGVVVVAALAGCWVTAGVDAARSCIGELEACCHSHNSGSGTAITRQVAVVTQMRWQGMGTCGVSTSVGPENLASTHAYKYSLLAKAVSRAAVLPNLEPELWAIKSWASGICGNSFPQLALELGQQITKLNEDLPGSCDHLAFIAVVALPLWLGAITGPSLVAVGTCSLGLCCGSLAWKSEKTTASLQTRQCTGSHTTPAAPARMARRCHDPDSTTTATTTVVKTTTMAMVSQLATLNNDDAAAMVLQQQYGADTYTVPQQHSTDHKGS